ncbi:glycoside hydrolase family 1 [Ignisphaera aggregans DSM 17230]|uniref:Glycoside hydrolase family 1 n=1 Tax=Ignisphaera aggregans (strain DSM 17230 / JCM 13409 / AQ1.S1) TaxID=583356 RepID=E0STZ0_IGNAA|nr:glycoside hydrolase family 1 [Ignisphaera aggregans DSM 17230]
MGLKYPKEFIFGFSESGFQFEMGLPGSEDPNTDWWVWVHDPENIASTLVSGDFPENGPGYWHLYRQDHDIAERLGMDGARIGIEWSRIFSKPTFDVKVDVARDERGNIVYIDVAEKALEELDRIANKDAVNHYREILSDWKNRGKKLIINLYHWTLPLWLHDPIKVRKLGIDRAPAGWVDERTVIEFVKYVAYIAWKLGDLPDLWCTMNEPNVVYSIGYINIKIGYPPGYLSFEAASKAMKHLVEAHARAYEVLKRFTNKPVGIIYVTTYHEPLKESDRDVAEAAMYQAVFDFLDSITIGRSMSIGERKDLEKHLDWLGINYYSRLVVERYGNAWRVLPGYGFACIPGGTSLAGRPCNDAGWETYPEGLYIMLKRCWERYRLPIIVTENGTADAIDRLRPRYLATHLYQVWKALSEGVDIRGYLHWALVDNYEWSSGFRMRFGLVHVDFETKKRYLRPSALLFREIASSKEIPDEFMHMTQPQILI